MLWKKIIVVLGVLALAGCAASQAPKPYDDKRSFALNIVRAAGMTDIRDHALPQAEYDKLTSGTLYQAAWAGAITNAPAPGISSGAAMGLGILSVLFEPKADSARDAIIAWMPASLAPNEEEAAKLLRDTTQKAIVKTLSDLGLEVVDEHASRHFIGFTGATIFRDDTDLCEETTQKTQKSACMTFTSGRDPKVQNTPDFIKNQEQVSYAFGVSSAWRNAILIKYPNPDKLNSRMFFQQLSKNVPDWVFLYSAPEGEKASERKNLSLCCFTKGSRTYSLCHASRSLDAYS